MSYIIPGSSSIVWKDRGQGPQSWGDISGSGAITSNADGDKLAAVVYDGNVWLSTDYGVTWTENTTSPGVAKKWTSIASNGDGTKLYATVGNTPRPGGTGGDLWWSHTSGATWTDQGSLANQEQQWLSIATNEEGDSVVAISIVGGSMPPAGGRIWKSIDYGLTWSDSTPGAGPYPAWRAVTSSYDTPAADSKFAVTIYGGNIWTSHGVNPWVERTGSGIRDWWGITSDSTGVKLAAVVYGGNIWLSVNIGVAWAEVNLGPGAGQPPLNQNWRDIASDSTGSILTAVIDGGSIWKSTDSGATWTEDTSVGVTKNWVSVASNITGSNLAATVYDGNIWTWPGSGTAPDVLMPNPACDPQIGGPQPPRLWSRATEDCINTGVLVPAVPAHVSTCCDDFDDGIWQDRVNSRVWSCVASGSDGDKLVAADYNGSVFTSPDCGKTWTDTGGPAATDWVSIACNTTANIIAVMDIGGEIWMANEPVFPFAWPADPSVLIIGGDTAVAITMSSDGSVVAAVSYDTGTGDAYFAYSVDTGATWTTQTFPADPAYQFTSISSNAAGSQLILCSEDGALSGRVYIALSGAYTPVLAGSVGLPAGALDWSSVASNASGNVLMAANTGHAGARYIYVSKTSGLSWSAGSSPVSAPTRWSSLASNDAGDVLVAVSEGVGIYSSTDFGDSWTLFNPPPPASVITNGGTQKCIASDSTGKKLVAVFGDLPTNGHVWTYCNDPPTPAIPAVMSTVTQQDLDMRRKAEILQYKKNNSNMSKKQLWARTIKGYGPSGNRTWATQSAGGTYTNPNIDNLEQKGFMLVCPGRPNNCAPTTHSDVPGKQMMLCMRPDVPLTNYIVNRTYLAGGTKWPQTAWKPGDKGFPVGKAGRSLVFK